MPAGNDAQAAVAELADKLGAGEARAEDLQLAQQQALSDIAREVQYLDRDSEASDEVDWAKAAKAVDADVKVENVRDVAVRGKYVVVVYTADDRRDYKAYGLAKDAGVETEKAKATRKRTSKSAKD